MRHPRRRTALVVAGLIAAVAAVVAGALLLRGPGPDEVAEDYLDALWSGDWETQCELSSQDWRPVIFEGFPFGSCEEYAEASAKAEGGGDLDPGDDLVVLADVGDVQITVVELSEGDGRARVSYLVEYEQQGADASERGTIELVDVDGGWQVAGVAFG